MEVSGIPEKTLIDGDGREITIPEVPLVGFDPQYNTYFSNSKSTPIVIDGVVPFTKGYCLIVRIGGGQQGQLWVLQNGYENGQELVMKPLEDVMGTPTGYVVDPKQKQKIEAVYGDFTGPERSPKKAQGGYRKRRTTKKRKKTRRRRRR